MELISRYKITRDDETHAYTVDYKGEVQTLPGVTGILDVIGSRDKLNRLIGWSKKQSLLKVAEHLREFIGKPFTMDEAAIEAIRKSAWKKDKQVLKDAGDLGTRCHQAIDNYIVGRTPKLDSDTQQSYDNFLQWLKGSGIEIIKGDTYIANLELGYGGAMDALGKTKEGELILVDFKTSNNIQDVYAIQAAAYVLAFNDTFDTTIQRAIVLRMGKEKPGDIEPKEVNLPWAITNWNNALRLHNSMKQQIWKAQ